MRKIIICILAALMLTAVYGCDKKEGFVEPILKSRLYTDSNDPCISLLFPFDVAMGKKETETISGVYLHTRYLTSSDYVIRVVKMSLERGFFRNKPLSEVYKDADVLYERGYDQSGKTSAVVLRQTSAEGCEFIKGRIEHRVGDRSMVDIDFRKKLADGDDINAEKKKMISAVNAVYEKMIVSFCAKK